MPVTNYFWDPVEDNVLEEYDENGDTIVEYETEPDLYGNLISQERDGVASYYHFDGQGSTLALTSKDGDVTDEYAYNAFGETTEQSGTTANTRRYIGEKGYHYNTDTDDYSVRQRTYEPLLVRWFSVDPALGGTDSNGFIYVNNRPAVFVDPSGLECPVEELVPRSDSAGNECDDLEKFSNIIEIRIEVKETKLIPLYNKCLSKYKAAGEPLGKDPSFKTLANWCIDKGYIGKKDIGKQAAKGKSDVAGHTWIWIDGMCVEKGVGYGYWPSGDFLGSPGIVIDEANNGHGGFDYYTHYKRFKVCRKTCDCVKKEIDKIKANPGNYDPLDRFCNNTDRHCSTFPIEVLSNCGFTFKKYVPGSLLEPADIQGWPGVWPKGVDSDKDHWGNPFES